MGKADEEIQKAIDAGCYVVEILLDGKTEIGRKEYNKPKEYLMSKRQVESFARSILPAIEEYYSHEENQKAFEEWMRERNAQQDK